jgi:hypothetical protein
MLRSLVKVGVTSGGVFTFIPRPESIGHFLLGALGNVGAATQIDTSAAYSHAFDLGTDQFAAPYFTIRSSPGGLWGETFQDSRVAALGLNWKAADYVRASVALLGGTPTPNVSTAAWTAASLVDSGPQLLAPLGVVELPTGTSAKVLSGSFAAGMDIPLDEQWITGSYEPDDFDINQRSFTLTLAVKLTDGSLYEKIMYDPAAGGAWAASVFKEANINLQFVSDQEADTGYPYSILVEANGSTGAAANVAWSATPIRLRAGTQVTMAVTGTFLADPAAGQPITVTLTNQRTTDY